MKRDDGKLTTIGHFEFLGKFPGTSWKRGGAKLRAMHTLLGYGQRTFKQIHSFGKTFNLYPVSWGNPPCKVGHVSPSSWVGVPPARHEGISVPLCEIFSPPPPTLPAIRKSFSRTVYYNVKAIISPRNLINTPRP